MARDSPGARLARVGIVVLALALAPLREVSAEDAVEVKMGYYLEDNGRTEAYSPSLRVEKDLSPDTVLKIQGVYDVISGATPTGAPPRRKTRETTTESSAGATSYVAVSGASGRIVRVPVRSTTKETKTTVEEYGSPVLPMAEYEDERLAVNAEVRHRHEDWVYEAGLAFSDETDYTSYAASARISRDFNDRMTTLTFGLGATHDDVLDFPEEKWTGKETLEAQIQVAQLLDENTYLKVSYVGGSSWGYLDDPYKVVELNGEVVPENRPGSRDRHALYVSLNRNVEPLRGAAEATYRFFADSYGVTAHTWSIDWFQKLGPNLTLIPGIRYYRQSAADFLASEFTGNPSVYSSDYRLSKMGSFTYGAKLVWKFSDTLQADLAYDRYSQFARDGEISGEAYPEANVVTMGMKLWF